MQKKNKKKKYIVTTFKIFRHNYWTEYDNHRLYDGKYYPLKANEIATSPHENLIYFTVPAARKPYQNGVWMKYAEFPQSIKKIAFLWKNSSGEEKKKSEKNLIKQLQEYFVKRVNITKKQAEGVMRTEDAMYAKKWPIKRIHAVHARLGLST